MVLLSRRDRWSRSRLERHQNSSLRRLRDFAFARSAFYRRFHRGLERVPLHELPVLTRDTLMDAFDDTITVPGVTRAKVEDFTRSMSVTDLLHGRYHVVATSGTTGNKGYFLFSKKEWRILAMAGVARGIGWTGANPRRGRGVVMASTIPWHMTARAGAELRRVGLDGGRLSLDAAAPVEKLVADLNPYQPTTMMVYPSVMQILAGEQMAGRLRIAPEHIQCTSEVLTHEASSEIARAFGIVPANLYASSECGCMAASCALRQGLHVSEDLLIIESVDEMNRPVPDGTLGAKALVTVLGSRTLPLIRYEISDRIARDAAPCGCGKPYARLSDVGGRQGDLLRLPGVTGGTVEIAPAQITAALRGTAVRQWQLTLMPDEWTVSCVCDASEFRPAAISKRLETLLRERGARLPTIRVDRIDQVRRGVTGKMQVVR